MSRFPVKQVWDRTHAPPPGAAGDGIHQGAAYHAVIQTAVANKQVAVTIPALHLTSTFKARIKEGTAVTPGTTVCLVIFDDEKVPWVIATL